MSSRAPQYTAPRLASGVIALLPAFQSASDPSPQIDRISDISGLGNHALLGANAPARATVWGTASRCTSTDNTSGTQVSGPSLAWSAINWNKDTESLLIHGMWSGAAGTNRWIVGFGSNSVTTVHGFLLRANSAGTLRLQSSDSGSLRNYNDSAATVADGTIHAVTLMVDGTTKRAHVWIDGVYDATLNGGAGTDWSAYSATMTAFGPLVLGGCPTAAAKDLTYASTHYGWQVAKRTGALPANMNEIARRLARQPLQGLTSFEWPA